MDEQGRSHFVQQITFSLKNRKLNSTEEQTVSELKNLPSV